MVLLQDKEVVAHLSNPWNDGDYRVGDPVNIIDGKTEVIDGVENRFVGREYGGYLIHYPDVLLGATSVNKAMECTRRGYLAERFRGEGTNAACVTGTMYHSMFEQALVKNYRRQDQLKNLANEIVSSMPETLLDSNLTEKEALDGLYESIPITLRYDALSMYHAANLNSERVL